MNASFPSEIAWRRYLFALLVLSAALLISLLARPVFQSPSLLFVIAIMAIAWHSGLAASLLATAIAAVSINYFFIVPHFAINQDPESILRIAVFILVSFVISSLTASQRRSSQALQTAHDHLESRVRERTAELAAANETLSLRERQRAAVAELGEKALAGMDLDRLMEEAVASIARTVQADICQYWDIPAGGRELTLKVSIGLEGPPFEQQEADSRALAANTLESGQPLVVDDFASERRFQPPTSFLEAGASMGVGLVVRGYRPFGVLVAVRREPVRFTREDIHHLQTVANILADAVDRKESENVLEQQTAALVESLRTLIENPDLDSFLDRTVIALRESLRSTSVTLWLYDAAERLLVSRPEGEPTAGSVIGASYLTTAEAIQPAVTYTDPLWRELVRRRRPILLRSGRLQTEDGEPVLFGLHESSRICSGSDNVLLVPMLLGQDPIGLFCIGFGPNRTLRPEEEDLSQALAQQATLAVHLIRLARSTQESAILQERNRMAREIHDTLAQGFTGIVVHLEAADYALSRSPQHVQRHIEEAKSLARSSLAEARRSVWALRPQALEDSTLPAALAKLSTQMSTAGVQVLFTLRGVPWPLAQEVEHNLLRICQEAVTNAIRHGRCSQVRLALAYGPDGVCLQIDDDGCGFDPQALEAAGHGSRQGLGLRGMRERAERIGSKLEVNSFPGQGASVTIRLSESTRMHASSADSTESIQEVLS